MATKKVRIDEITKVVNDYLMNYREDIQEDVEEATNKVTKEAVRELKTYSKNLFGNSGREKPYFSGWTTKLQKKGKLKYHKVIWNKTNYQLTHLLEFGHATQGGGYAKAYPHIKPIEQKYNQEFVDLVESKIRRQK